MRRARAAVALNPAGRSIGGYVLLAKQDSNLALIVGLGPWVLAIVVLFFSMITGNEQ